VAVSLQNRKVFLPKSTMDKVEMRCCVAGAVRSGAFAAKDRQRLPLVRLEE
jgi:hypothetical protein